MRGMIDLRTIRRTLRMTQAEMAGRLGLHQTTISRMETGELPIDERTALALDAIQMRARPAESAAA